MILLLNIEIANALQNTQYTGIISKAKTNFKLKNKAENFNANSKSFFFLLKQGLRVGHILNPSF